MTSFAHQAAQIDGAVLAKYLEARLPGFRGPIEAQKTPTGQSNPTFILSSPSGKYVLRKKPPGQLLKSAHQVDREYRVMKGLEGTDVPVPRMLHLCEDDAVIGTAFYVMAFVAGTVFWDPALPELTNGQRAKLYDEQNRALAALHSVDPAKVGLSDFGRAGSYFARQRDRWTKQYRASETEAIEDMETLISWLERNEPPDDGGASLVHGDYRIDNMIFAPDGSRLLAIIDWELSTIGHPFSDSRLPVHAVAPAQPRRHARPCRSRPQGARHPDRGGVCRRVRRAHGASGNSALEFLPGVLLLPPCSHRARRQEARARRQRVQPRARAQIGRDGAGAGTHGRRGNFRGGRLHQAMSRLGVRSG